MVKTEMYYVITNIDGEVTTWVTPSFKKAVEEYRRMKKFWGNVVRIARVVVDYGEEI